MSCSHTEVRVLDFIDPLAQDATQRMTRAHRSLHRIVWPADVPLTDDGGRYSTDGKPPE